MESSVINQQGCNEIRIYKRNYSFFLRKQAYGEPCIKAAPEENRTIERIFKWRSHQTTEIPHPC